MPTLNERLAIAAAITIAGTLSAGMAAPRATSVAVTLQDIHWIDRITWGADSQTLSQLHALGRRRFLDGQLRAEGDARLPPDARATIDALAISQPIEALAAGLIAERRRIAVLPTEDERRQARQALRQSGDRLVQEARTRQLLRALYSPAQLQERLDWFWLNHFSVFAQKAGLRWLVADYDERAIRPHVLGRFRDLLRAVLTHPAMLVYLDNAQSAAGRLNENLARELLELHTLGVDGGYAQRDVTELARVLTGLGVNLSGRAPRLPARLAPAYVRSGLFEFDPARHDFGTKTVLGTTIDGTGLPELDRVVDLLAAHPSTARFLSRKLAAHFMADDPPAALVDRMARSYLASGGDLARTMRTLIESPEFAASAGRKFKDPMQWTVSALRLAGDGQRLLDARPALGWIAAQGEPLFGRLTPDGYGLAERDWSGSGQLARRFEIARAIGAGSGRLFAPASGEPSAAGVPRLEDQPVAQALGAALSPATRAALDAAASPAERNALWLSAPEFMYH